MGLVLGMFQRTRTHDRKSKMHFTRIGSGFVLNADKEELFYMAAVIGKAFDITLREHRLVHAGAIDCCAFFARVVRSCMENREGGIVADNEPIEHSAIAGLQWVLDTVGDLPLQVIDRKPEVHAALREAVRASLALYPYVGDGPFFE
jgi:hypothetical protein